LKCSGALKFLSPEGREIKDDLGGKISRPACSEKSLDKVQKTVGFGTDFARYGSVRGLGKKCRQGVFVDLSMTYPQALKAPAPEMPPGEADKAEGGSGAFSVSDEQQAELESILDRLKSALTALDRCGTPSSADEEEPGARVTAMLSESIVRMQDDFLGDLCTGLKERGVDFSSKFTLRLDEDARLEAIGDERAGAAAEEILASRPDLTALFTETAVRAALLRGLHDLRNAVRHACAEDIYAALNASAGAGFYQVSIKGDMSHFYFAR
jgi:hypothetical protein